MMKTTNSVNSKKSGEKSIKSVKFDKNNPISSSKKKFAKTPHSSKLEKISSTQVLKKRKLSFSDCSTDMTISPAQKKIRKSDAIKTLETSKTALTPDKKRMKKEKVSSDSTVKTERSSVKKDFPQKSKEIGSKKVITMEEEKKRFQEKTERTIYVGNIPITKTKEDIAKLFSKFGKVENARLRCIQLAPGVKSRKGGAILKKYAGQPLSAYVKFQDPNSPHAALALNGTLLDGHHIRVDLVESKKKSIDYGKAIFLRQLPFDLTDDELWSTFEKCGEVESVRIIKDVQSYKSRGLGYVNFTSAASVELALKMDNEEIKGRPIRVHRCTGTRNQQGVTTKKPKKKHLRKKSAEEPGSEFSGKQATLQKKKKQKKQSNVELKKKQIAKVLSS